MTPLTPALRALSLVGCLVIAACASNYDAWKQRLDTEQAGRKREHDERQSARQRELDQIKRDAAAWFAQPTDEEVSAADFGPPPPNGWEAIVEDAVRRTLKDPEAGRFRFHHAERSWSKAGEGAPFTYFWKVPYEVNAKNSFGGYTGFQSAAVFFKDGRWFTWDDIVRERTAWREQRDQDGGAATAKK